MAKRKRRRGRHSKQTNQTLKIEIIGLILIALSVIAIVSGNKLFSFAIPFYYLFGEWYMAGILGVIALAGFMIVKRQWPKLLNRRLIGIYLIFACILLLNHIKFVDLKIASGDIESNSIWNITHSQFIQNYQHHKVGEAVADLGGGITGAILLIFTYFLFDSLGAKILSFFLVLIGLILITGRSLGDVLIVIGKKIAPFFSKQWKVVKQDIKEWKQERKEKNTARKKDEKIEQSERAFIKEDATKEPEEPLISEPIISSFTETAYPIDEPKVEKVTKNTEKEEIIEEDELVPAITFTELENKDYQLPPLSLLTRSKTTDQSSEYKMIHENAAKLERTFHSFGVKAKVTQVHLGPAVTKYEVHPEAGVKVSRIVSLSDDIALALAAKGIRIEAPIPGKSAIGIEVPNSEIAIVSLREVLDSKEHDKPEAKLQIGLGRDITGQAVVAELNKMPHLLVAGATGSGKSVCINGIITSILMRAKPHEVKMMMIDPKMVELNVYNGVPHLLAPVVTDPKKASQALKKVVNEMERRYELFSHTGTRNIEGYNEYMMRLNHENDEKQPLLPFIVVIVDELADLMMVASNDVEDSITRLAQMARAAGIHLIIATQRPSVDVITGVIKANIPSRIAFAVSSQIDSRTILDTSGAEKLFGRGDMLFQPVGATKPIRVQGAFLSDQEVEEVVDFVISQQKAQYQEEMIPDDVPEVTGQAEDELFDEAVQLIAEMQTASVSMLQRRFRIGYTRAARLIDEMEARGIVGPYEGSKPRTVLVPKQAEEHTS
ncbi:DNA translocase FtsK [Bacillus sp. FJAT-50079]|uniref:DNA translocase FtsK n=1 Tax=Bacillus sp. FJAT-50079 TaxID=2833577 RepID=UPI001BCA5941|nr:DNA translocase FtsK [Bacillus sp. FJAT-50079]MBS4207563.1 DNA translocase FtsK [Bacillus sp. FJAT-50079]